MQTPLGTPSGAAERGQPASLESGGHAEKHRRAISSPALPGKRQECAAGPRTSPRSAPHGGPWVQSRSSFSLESCSANPWKPEGSWVQVPFRPTPAAGPRRFRRVGGLGTHSLRATGMPSRQP